MGVFATRSPYRPNRLGLSSVRLLSVEDTRDRGLVLLVTGADLLDGTPIYDIKPYLSFSDAHPEARNGFAEQSRDYRLPVTGLRERLTDEALIAQLEEILSQDPRPAYQEDPERIYRMDYAGCHVEFCVRDGVVYVESITQ